MQVAVFLTGWLVFWMGAGAVLAACCSERWARSVNGFLIAIVATFAWPWIMPAFIDDWMDDDHVPTW